MAKFFGTIGFVGAQSETAPGVWEESVIERKAFGDVLRNTRRLREGEYLNDDISVENRVSVVMDAYARDNFHAIRYVNWAGVLWTVDTVDVESPRLVLRLGGVYNGPSPSSP